MSLSIEELLKPRYKVIADWPEDDFSVSLYFTLNSILEFNHVDFKNRPLYKFWKNGQHRELALFQLDKFPHLFKKLEWWEERKESDMPEYLKIEEVIYKIERWENYFGLLPHEYNPKKDSSFKVKHHFNKGLPATEKEYLEYIDQSK